MSTTPLFTLPIPTETPGTIVCTQPAPSVYLLTFTAPADNRLVTAFCHTFLLALDIIEFSYPPGVVVTTSGIPKFYSNGLDLKHATTTDGFFSNTLPAVFKRLLTYPMPTIALLNGHAFAGGLMLAMYHDYRIGNPAKGFLCLNELDFGVPLSPYMSSIFREKLGGATYRALVLEAKRFAGPEALTTGIVDALGDLAHVLAMVDAQKLAEKAKSGVYGQMKSEMYRETLAYLNDTAGEDGRLAKMRGQEKARVEEGKKKIAQWKTTAKL